MRIAQVLLRPAIGGAESLVASLEAPLRALGHDPRTVHLDQASQPTDPVSRTRRLRRVLRALRPDVVVGHGALPNAYLRMAFPGPNVTVLHSAVDDFAERRLRVAEHVLRSRTRAIVAVSARQQREYTDRFGERIPVAVIPNGIGAEFTPPEAGPAPSGRVVTLARVAGQKDPETWASIAASAVESREDVAFTWWGPDDPTDPLTGRIARRTGSDRVRFAGPTADPAGVLRGADLVLHTSRSEAHPVALLEAAAAGVPIVCTDEVAHTATSLVIAGTFAAGDADAGARTVLRVLDRIEEHRSLALSQAPDVQERFGIDRCAAAYDRLLRSLVTAR